MSTSALTSYTLPTANAFTIAGIIGVDVGHCTYRFLCETHVCGDHICKAGEWKKMKEQQTTITIPKAMSPSNVIRNNTILTLQAIPIFPKNGVILINFPTSLQIQVTRGGYPVQGATVQFWFAEHNAGLTVTDSSGYAYLTLLNQNTLDAGYYSWHATAIKTGFRGGSTSSSYFIIPSGNIAGLPSGTVSTDKKEYFIGHGDNLAVKISGNVNGYNLGDAIILKIISPSGKVTQLAARGLYLGAFQASYKLDNSEVGVYTVTAFYKYAVFSTDTFNVLKSGS
ncbi:MAG: hypothetical protein ACREA3_02850 [Nitrosotalea sp.]